MTALALARPAAPRYLAIALTSLRRDAAERSLLIGRAAFYAVILLIFSRLWHVVGERGIAAGAGPVELLWYLAITEWVMLSAPPLFLEVDRDVRTGDIAYQLPRPVSYIGARLAEAAGTFCLRAVLLAFTGMALAWTMSGGWPEDPRGLLLALPLGLAAGALVMICNAIIGLTAFWLEDSTPVYWIWQKCAFVLGGLMIPLDVYPDWLRAVADWLPFAALMYGPGRMAFGWDPGFAGVVAVRLLVWGALACLLLVFVYRRGLAALDVNGG